MAEVKNSKEDRLLTKKLPVSLLKQSLDNNGEYKNMKELLNFELESLV